MGYMATDDLDPYDDDAREAAEMDYERDRLLTAYEDARAALLTITPGMDRTTRWMILDRYAQVAMQMEVEMTREPLHTISCSILAEIRGAA